MKYLSQAKTVTKSLAQEFPSDLGNRLTEGIHDVVVMGTDFTEISNNRIKLVLGIGQQKHTETLFILAKSGDEYSYKFKEYITSFCVPIDLILQLLRKDIKNLGCFNGFKLRVVIERTEGYVIELTPQGYYRVRLYPKGVLDGEFNTNAEARAAAEAAGHRHSYRQCSRYIPLEEHVEAHRLRFVDIAARELSS